MRRYLVLAACLLPLSQPAVAQPTRTIRLLHFADMNGELRTVDCQPGTGAGPDFAALVHALDEERAAGNTLVLPAGGTIGSAPFLDFLISQGPSGIATLGALLARTSPALLVPGMAELTIPYRGFMEALPDLDAAGVPYRGLNITCSDGSPACAVLSRQTPPIVTVAGVRIALLPLVGPRVAAAAHPENLVGVTVIDPVEAAALSVATLRRLEAADLVVAVVSLETGDGSVTATMDFLRRVEGVDIVIAGGLSSRGQDRPLIEIARAEGGRPFLVGSPRGPAALGIVTLRLDGRGEGFVLADVQAEVRTLSPLARDEQVAMQLSQTVSEFCSIEARPLGTGRIDPPMDWTAFVDYTGEILRRRMGADLALLSADSVRLDRSARVAGPVTAALLHEAFERHEVVVVGILGSDLLPFALAWSQRPDAQRTELRLLGLDVAPDLSVTVNGRPLNPRVRYLVATTDFLAGGGRGLLAPLLALPQTSVTPTGFFLQEVVHRFFEKDLHASAAAGQPICAARNFAPLWERPLWETTFTGTAGMTSVSIDNRGGYSEAQLARARFTGMASDGQLLVSLSSRDHAATEFVRLQYGLAATGDQDLSETQDLLTQELTWAWTRVRNDWGNGQPFVPSPVLKGKVETELTTAPHAAHHHLELTGMAGLQWSLAPAASAGLGYALRNEVLSPDDPLHHGLQLYYQLLGLPLASWERVNALTLDSRFELFTSDWSSENIVKAVGSTRICAALFSSLSFSAGIDLFLFRSGQGPVSFSLDTSVGLTVALDSISQQF